MRAISVLRNRRTSLKTRLAIAEELSRTPSMAVYSQVTETVQKRLSCDLGKCEAEIKSAMREA